jgi:hypothetical protein
VEPEPVSGIPIAKTHWRNFCSETKRGSSAGPSHPSAGRGWHCYFRSVGGCFRFEGNPGGSPEATRRAFNKRFLLDLAEDWQQHGREVFKRVRRESPAAYLKVCAMLVPKEMKVEHSGGVKAMSDEQLEQTLEAINGMLAAREAAVIDGVPEPVPALPPPSRKPRRKVRRSDRADSGLAARVVGTDSADGNS